MPDRIASWIGVVNVYCKLVLVFSHMNVRRRAVLLLGSSSIPDRCLFVFSWKLGKNFFGDYDLLRDSVQANYVPGTEVLSFSGSGFYLGL